MSTWFLRVPRWIRITGVFVLAGAVTAVTASLVVGKATRTYESPGANILISDDGRTLTSSRGGSCGAVTPEVVETGTTVVLKLRTYPHIMTAPGSCALVSYSVTLHAPLGKRTLVDGVTNKVLYGFGAQHILRPGWLPAGFVHRYDTATIADETVAGSQGGCVQLYTRGDGYDDELFISQDSGASWQAPDGAPPGQPITVRGHQGTAIPVEIEWTENGQLVTIRSMAYAYVTPHTETLIAIAEALLPAA